MSIKPISINTLCIVNGGTDGFGLADLYRLSFDIKSLKADNIFSNSDRLSFFGCIAEGSIEAMFSGDREGLPIRGEGSGELTLDEIGVALGVRIL